MFDPDCPDQIVLVLEQTVPNDLENFKLDGACIHISFIFAVIFLVSHGDRLLLGFE